MDFKKCLIVDDDEVGRETIAQQLATVECVMAASGREAVERFSEAIAKSEPFNLILLDIMMPDMNGHETGKAIRQIEKEKNVPAQEKCKIVMLTALNTPKDVMESMMSSQSSAYLVKPLDSSKLKETLSKIGLRIPK